MSIPHKISPLHCERLITEISSSKTYIFHRVYGASRENCLNSHTHSVFCHRIAAADGYYWAAAAATLM